MRDRRELMERFSVSGGCRERMIRNLVEEKENRKVERQIRKRYYRGVSVMITLLLCMILLGTNDTVQANVQKILRNFHPALKQASDNFNEDLAPYTKELDYKATKDGYTLSVYKIAVTESIIVLEYSLKDEFGNLVNEMPFYETNINETYFLEYQWDAFFFEIPVKEPNGKSRAYAYYNEGNFVALEGETILLKFRFPLASDSINGPSVEFEMEIELEKVYPKTIYSVEKNLQIDGNDLLIRQVVDDGLFWRVDYEWDDVSTWEEHLERYQNNGHIYLVQMVSGQEQRSIDGLAVRQDGYGSRVTQYGLYEKNESSKLTFRAVYEKWIWNEAGTGKKVKFLTGEETSIIVQ